VRHFLRQALEEDHANAKRLAQGLSQIEGIKLAYTAIPTNIVFFDLLPEISGAIFTAELNNVGVKVGNRGRNLFRAVTHRMVSEKDIDEAVVKIAGVCKKLQRKV
jgi:threonine aldolase